jgi:hypothetical protein
MTLDKHKIDLLERMFEKCNLLPSDGRGVAFGPHLSVDPEDNLP